MTTKNFHKLLKEIQTKQDEVFKTKQSEYVAGENQFYNFKRAALIAATGSHRADLTTPLGALYGMMMKHLVSSLDILENPEGYSIEIIKEKFGDLRNYLILAEGIIEDERR